MNKKGFTLIELIAVILIIAIISLISVSMITGVIDKAKKGALKDSAYGLIDAAALYYSENNEGINSDITFDCSSTGCSSASNEKINYKGSIDGTGSLILFTDGKTALCINSDKYSVLKNIGDTEVSLISGTCEYDETTKSYVDIPMVSKTLYDDMRASYESQLAALNQEITSGKTKIAASLTDKGLTASASDSFDTLAATISSYNIDISSKLITKTRDFSFSSSISGQENWYVASSTVTFDFPTKIVGIVSVTKISGSNAWVSPCGAIVTGTNTAMGFASYPRAWASSGTFRITAVGY